MGKRKFSAVFTEPRLKRTLREDVVLPLAECLNEFRSSDVRWIFQNHEGSSATLNVTF